MQLFGVVVMAMVAVFLVLVTRRGSSEEQMDAVLEHRERQRDTRLLHGQRGLQRLQAADPSFDPQAFVELANAAIHRAWDSWRNETPEQVRRYISDSAWEEYLRMMAAISAGRRRDAGEMPTYTLMIIAAVHEAERERITIEAEVAGEGGEAAWQSSGEATDASSMWIEKWVWERSLAGAGEPDVCAQCGAALGALDWRCPRCGVPVPPQPHEWHAIRIARVTLERLAGVRPEPMAAPLLPVPGGDLTAMGEPLDAVPDGTTWGGAEAIEAHDPAFDETDCVATASEMLNQVLLAWQRQDLSGLEQWVTPTLARDIRQRADAYRQRHLVNRLPEVEVSQVVVARIGSDDRLDRVDLGVRGRGANIDVDRSGVAVTGVETPAMWAEVWRLQRSSHATTKVREDTACCPRCGAPRGTDEMGACGFCGDEMDADSFGWRFAAVAPLD